MTTVGEVVRLFPLPNVVLFPRVDLPLHVFEPRYRELVRDALGDDRLIGMALLRGDWRRRYEGRPDLFSLGCAGAIENLSMLPDGRSNLILKGLSRFEILEEIDGPTLYRRARVRWLPDRQDEVSDLVGPLRTLVERLLTRRGAAVPPDLWERLPREGDKLVNALAFALDLPVVEKLALLECDGPRTRAERLAQLVEFQLAMPYPGAPEDAGGTAH